MSGVLELLLLRLIHSSCPRLQQPKVVQEGEGRERGKGLRALVTSTLEVSKTH